MSIVQEILYIVSNYPGGYRTIYDLLYDSAPASKRFRLRGEPSANTTKSTLTRLRKRGLVINKTGTWHITPEGKEFLHIRSRAEIKEFSPNTTKTKGKKVLIIAFDIPEKRRRYRDWLRMELIGFGFEQVQKSVWFGPALPKEFVDYLQEEKLLPYIRFFKATPEDLI